MLARWLLAALHLLGWGIALGSIWARSRALRDDLDGAGLKRVFAADNWWGASAGILLATGLVRAFAGWEKGTQYYVTNHLFWTKMGLFVLVFALEIWPMVTLIRWRQAARRGEPIDLAAAGRMASISSLQAGLLVLILLAATGMARGLGMPSR